MVVGFFSASSCKLVPYILPAWWPLAVSMAAWVGGAVGADRLGRGVAASMRVTGVFAALLIGAAVYYGLHQTRIPLDGFVIPGAILVLGGLVCAAAFLVAPAVGGLDRRMGLMVAASVVVLGSMIPTYRQVSQYKDLAGLIPSGLQPVAPTEGWTIAQYRCYNQALSYYTHHRVVLIDAVNEINLGLQAPDAAEWFREGAHHIARLAARGPLALVTREEEAEQVAKAYGLQVWARNDDRAMLVNAAGLRRLGAAPSPGGHAER